MRISKCRRNNRLPVFNRNTHTISQNVWINTLQISAADFAEERQDKEDNALAQPMAQTPHPATARETRLSSRARLRTINAPPIPLPKPQRRPALHLAVN